MGHKSLDQRLEGLSKNW